MYCRMLYIYTTVAAANTTTFACVQLDNFSR